MRGNQPLDTPGGNRHYVKETAPPLVEGLFDEIEWATEDEPTEELRESFKFKKYIMFTRVFQDDDQEVSLHSLLLWCGGSLTRTDASDTLCGQANKKRKREEEQVLVYTRPEDQFFHKVCKWSFQWKARDSEGASYSTSWLLFCQI